MTRRSSRRRFLQQTALAAGFWVAGSRLYADSKSPLERLNIACIGVGGKGDSDSSQAANHGHIVAICDIDDHTLDNKAKDKRFEKAQRFHDFRKMFEEVGKDIDAVTVSTPDHIHAVAAVMAMRMKKHVYVQKPLTHTVFEARTMRETAREMGVCSQMGNQGTASDGLRRAVEIIRSGAIGGVREVHVWTNRPIWPQGAEAILKVRGARDAALAALHGKTLTSLPTIEVPKHVHWDLFLGPMPERPYDPIYHPFSWRGWWDFGTGALGDMACHTANMAFMALKLGSPTSVKAEHGDINPETYPMWAKIVFEFPAREEMPPVKLFWYEGQSGGKRIVTDKDKGIKRELLKQVLKDGEQLSDSGSMLVGDKVGDKDKILFSPNDYGESYRLLPEKDFEGYKPPEPSLPRNGKGDDGMKAEWVEAIKNNKPSIAMSNFDYAAMLTETILLGNVAMRVGKKMEWDGASLKSPNCPEAEQYIKLEYRKGYSL
jgi:predicted dehydrogenase